jgi:hypothetical protein
MNEDRSLDDQDAARWLDRLANDELDESSRLRLFEWLECDPERWRRCALALLEAKELQLGLGDWVSGDATTTTGPQAVMTPPDSTRVHRTLETGRSATRGALNSVIAAVAVLISFGMGMAVDQRWKASSHLTETNQRPQTGALTTSNDSQHVDSQQALQKMPTEAGPSFSDNMNSFDASEQFDQQALLASDPAPLPEYVRSQLERCGYRVDSEQKLISVTLSDGREMSIPVEEWKFEYAGIQAY